LEEGINSARQTAKNMEEEDKGEDQEKVKQEKEDQEKVRVCSPHAWRVDVLILTSQAKDI
jgi:hypothetical protein